MLQFFRRLFAILSLIRLTVGHTPPDSMQRIARIFRVFYMGTKTPEVQANLNRSHYAIAAVAAQFAQSLADTFYPDSPQENFILTLHGRTNRGFSLGLLPRAHTREEYLNALAAASRYLLTLDSAWFSIAPPPSSN